MNHDVDTVIRHLLALTGADPRKAKLPAGKRKVRVHTQRIGDVRLIAVAPMQGTLPEVEATLRTLVQQRIVIRGACVAQGIAVDAVQAVQED